MNGNTILILIVIAGIVVMYYEVRNHRRYIRQENERLKSELVAKHHNTHKELLNTKKALTNRLDKIAEDFSLKVSEENDEQKKN